MRGAIIYGPRALRDGRAPRTIALLAVAACAPVAAPTAPRVDEPLVGSWRLVSLEAPGEDGAMRRADATGQFVFSNEGQAAVQVMYRAPQADTPYVIGGYEATFGTYRVDHEHHTFMFHVEGALARPLVGKDLPRSYRLVGDQLVVTSTNPAEHWRVTWQRGSAR